MRKLAALPRFVWDFLVGDDPIVAFGVAVALGLTALAPEGSPRWLLAPLVATGLLWSSVRRMRR